MKVKRNYSPLFRRKFIVVADSQASIRILGPLPTQTKPFLGGYGLADCDTGSQSQYCIYKTGSLPSGAICVSGAMMSIKVDTFSWATLHDK